MVVYIQPEFCKYTGRTIYKLIFPDRKVYIGLASIFHKRIDKHKSEAYAKTDGDWKIKTRCKNAIRDFGWDNVKVEIMEFVPKYASLRDRETYWIEQYQSYKKEYGYNSNKGGGGPMAGVYKHTEETKAKISAGLMGHTVTEETKAKISAGLMGHTVTEETKAKMSAGLMGNDYAPKKPATSCKILHEYADGDQLVEFVLYVSTRDAAKKTKVAQQDISACCLKKRNSAGGFLWFFTAENHPPQIIKVGTIRVPRIGDKPRPPIHKRKVISVSPSGEKQLHEGARASGRTLSKSTGKKFDPGTISACCRGERKSHHGYTFCYE
jgi:group I intron endonuclease